MDTSVPCELRRIAQELEANYALIAEMNLEQDLEEIKRRFIESFKRTKGLEHLNPEKIWRQMQDSIL